MSENKCQFCVGDTVWLLPFDDLYEEYGDYRGVMYGIDKEYWEEAQRKSPLEITQIHIDGDAVRLKGVNLWWPVWALFPELPATCPAIEDLL